MKTIDQLEQEVRNAHPSWNDDRIRNKATRMFYLGEKL